MWINKVREGRGRVISEGFLVLRFLMCLCFKEERRVYLEEVGKILGLGVVFSFLGIFLGIYNGVSFW